MVTTACRWPKVIQCCCRATTNVRLWHPLEYDYYHTLRHKLGWTETPEGLSPRKR